MSKKTHSVGLNFEKQFGKGVDPWYAKAERWVKKKFKNPYLQHLALGIVCLLYTSPSPRDNTTSRMPSSA